MISLRHDWCFLIGYKLNELHPMLLRLGLSCLIWSDSLVDRKIFFSDFFQKFLNIKEMWNLNTSQPWSGWTENKKYTHKSIFPQFRPIYSISNEHTFYLVIKMFIYYLSISLTFHVEFFRINKDRTLTYGCKNTETYILFLTLWTPVIDLLVPHSRFISDM